MNYLPPGHPHVPNKMRRLTKVMEGRKKGWGAVVVVAGVY